MDRVVITCTFAGICHMQVCCEKDVTDEEILGVCNSKNPSGTSLGWALVHRENAELEMMRPCKCSEHSERLHILVGC